MEKYLITLDCNCMEKGCLYPCHLKGEVFANSFEEAFEKYTKVKFFAIILLSMIIVKKNIILVTRMKSQ